VPACARALAVSRPSRRSASGSGKDLSFGRAGAVAEFGGLAFDGFFAWLAWLFVHIYYLVGFRNRVLVLMQWVWVYLRFERGARLLTGDPARLIQRGVRTGEHENPATQGQH
jgi:NADH dehydrogenase